MYFRTLILFFLIIPTVVDAQTKSWSPLGVLVRPGQPIHITSDIRAAIPKGAKVRLLENTHLALDGEVTLIYDLGEYGTYCHLAVIKDNRRVADFRLATIFPQSMGAERFAFTQAAEFEAATGSHAFAAAFQNVGDGAGTLFVLLSYQGGGYEVKWKRDTTQGRFKVLRNGQVELWSGQGDGNCVWCEEHYDVTTYEWRDGALLPVHHFVSRHALSPYSVSTPSIVLEK